MAIFEGTEHNRFQPATGDRISIKFKWTDELLDELKLLRKQGQSFTQLANHFGITRNAIAGKCHRLGLCSEHVPAALKGENPKPKRTRDRTVKLRSRKKVAEPDPIYDPESSVWLPLRDLSDSQCHWIKGEPVAEALYCGAPLQKDSPYCAYHHRLCHEPNSKLSKTYQLIESSSAYEINSENVVDRRMSYLYRQPPPKITYLEPGRAKGAGDIEKWARRRFTK